nr:MAG TPA: Chromatin remodeling complex ATPase [Caudoviricetes sp.]
MAIPNISVSTQPSLPANIVAYDNRSRQLGVPFFSAFGFASNMEGIKKELNKKNCTVNFSLRYFGNIQEKKYEIITSAVPNSDYVNIIAFVKDSIGINETSRKETMTGFIFRHPEEGETFRSEEFENHLIERTLPNGLIDDFYDKLYKLSPVPVIKEWSYYLLKEMYDKRMFFVLETYCSDPNIKFQAFCFRAVIERFKELISCGLKEGHIRVSRQNNFTSVTMREMIGLDAYLNTFKDTLARRIQSSFVPRFIPDEDKYDDTLDDLTDYGSYMGQLELYDAQKSVVQAVSNAMNGKKVAYIIGETGVGKTAIAITSVLTHNKDRKALTNIVMCPGHLVEKWKKEVERLAPNSDAIIVSDFSELFNLSSRIKDRNRKRHLWIVLSKETAKFGYQERPVVVWNKSKKTQVNTEDGVYCCPECGEPLYRINYEGRGRWRREVRQYFTVKDFAHKTADNLVCMNKKKVWNDEQKSYVDVPCGAKLWGAMGKERYNLSGEDYEPQWVNLGPKVSWIERDKIKEEFSRIINDVTQKKNEKQKLPALSAALKGEFPPQRIPIKYSLGKYIRKFLRGYIDYALIDEMHLLKAKDSLQGQAFSDLVSAAKHSLCFTGTLLNGYASGIFYILYRTFPSLMKEEGFTFDGAGEQEFIKQYGVFKTTNYYEFNGNRRGNTSAPSKTKQLPGVSPIVFTKFLLENAAFISLEDIGTGLPGYEEIPVPITMDPELSRTYTQLEQNLHASIRRDAFRGGMKTMGQIVQMLSIYPDQPFDQPPIIHPDTGKIISSPPDLDESTQREKEKTFLALVQEKIQEGQKVLVYYHWTNRTQLAKRLTDILKEAGIKSAVLSASVNSRKREEWIKDQVEKKDIDVLICNPSLVETGLDLLDFTTIIYYQVGYNLFTLRQSSRRSWRLSQTKDVQVYFLYYRNTVQEQALSLMATKLQAAMAIEGKFSEEGLNAMSNNEDILTQIAASVVDGIRETVDVKVFSAGKVSNTQEKREKKTRLIDIPRQNLISLKPKKKIKLDTRAVGYSEEEVLNNVAVLFEAI